MADILLVDDDELVRNAMNTFLDALGYTVRLAAGGREALDMIAERPPDLVILDMVMPDMDGLEVCRWIRANQAWAKLPILFITAKAQENDMALGFEAGANDYLAKPFEVEEFEERVGALLAGTPGSSPGSESKIK